MVAGPAVALLALFLDLWAALGIQLGQECINGLYFHLHFHLRKDASKHVSNKFGSISHKRMNLEHWRCH